MRRRAAAIVVGLALALGACGGGGDDGDADQGDGSSTTEAAAAPTETLDGTEVLAAVGPSVALVETPVGSGSAVLLDDGHLVTNAHVVDPFDVVEVGFADEDPVTAEVVGVDLVADIAVLGPIDTDRPGTTFEDAADIPVGADLYLVGFPGDTQAPEPTISRGVLSRRREAPGWGLEMLQTDAAISDGQSGGAVVDAAGRVVGVSGLSYDDQFALALGGEDVSGSVDAILAGDGSEWISLPRPEDATETEATIPLDMGLGLDVLVLPEGVPDGRLEVTADEATSIEVDDAAMYPLAMNEVAAAAGGPEAADPAEDPDLPDPTAADAPGRWTFEVPADEPLVVVVHSDDLDATEVEVALSEPFAVVELYDDPRDIAVGDEVEGVVSALGEADSYALDLEAGEEVVVTASSAVGDMAFDAYPVDDPADPGVSIDDGGGGLLELDASTTLTAEADATYWIDVYQVDGYANAYRLTVDPA